MPLNSLRKEIEQLRTAVAAIRPSMLVKGQPALSHDDLCRRDKLLMRIRQLEAAERSAAKCES